MNAGMPRLRRTTMRRRSRTREQRVTSPARRPARCRLKRGAWPASGWRAPHREPASVRKRAAKNAEPVSVGIKDALRTTTHFSVGRRKPKGCSINGFRLFCVSSWRTGSDSAGRCRMVCCAILNELLSSGKTFRRSSSRGLLFDAFLDCLLCVLSRILTFGTAFRCLLSRLSLFTAFCAEGLRGLRRRPFSLQVGGDRQ